MKGFIWSLEQKKESFLDIEHYSLEQLYQVLMLGLSKSEEERVTKRFNELWRQEKERERE